MADTTDVEMVDTQPETEDKRRSRVVRGVRFVKETFQERQGQNVYEAFRHHMQLGENKFRQFEMVRPLHYYAARCGEEEETKSDEPEQYQIVAAFFDPMKHVPSNEPVRLCRTGIVKFAYHFTMTENKKTGKTKTVDHAVAFKIMDRDQLTQQQEDTQRERRVMSALRAEGFRKKRLNPLTEPDERKPTERLYEHFPQWRFFEDAHNEYMVTDYASNGNLLMYAKRRIESYCFDIAHLISTYMILDGFPSLKALTKLWRDEALFIFTGIVRAVVYMHRKGVCHLDLDVQNVVIDSLGNPILVDFGSSEVAGEDGIVACDRPILCKYYYCPPEVREHNRNITQSAGVDGRAADVYALGVIFYWLLFVKAAEGDIYDPVRCDSNWLLNVIHHVGRVVDTHDEEACAICRSVIPVATEDLQILQALLTKNPRDRISAEKLLGIVEERGSQPLGSSFKQSQVVFEQLRVAMQTSSKE
ncbi:hypothetical protein Poli38472_008706 [Pythium oligandrum]|uniref:non-specific serine/threonine protein kinase n=1 Tax=Pythium oligandrum TaxID=41045 RepID=A0A8K1C427_PYTOL|nr:hypothetical protein Poli38472_008706 [Pythium oligandrum]|eukprot:TMW56058.1 hypothetical protein Poli38472_008706 [Pythium oligandrum]